MMIDNILSLGQLDNRYDDDDHEDNVNNDHDDDDHTVFIVAMGWVWIIRS